ncbi:MAG: DUF167 domain-containing protein [Patescibacteria group bacterium]|nr:DUF167 domain-containing protein [Patescibacteria group bacterium]
MKIKVQVKAKSKQEKVAGAGDSRFDVWVKEPAIDGKANQAVIKALASHFAVSRLNVKIISGFKSKQKIIEVKI